METPQPQSRPARSSKTAVTPIWAAEGLDNNLCVDAQPFSPSATPIDKKVQNVRPLKVRNIYENLDSVPFTPSQGICTPSPTNVATMWVVERNSFHAEMSGYQTMGYAHSHWGTLAPMMSHGSHATSETGTSISDSSSIFTISDGTSLPPSPFGGVVPSYVIPVYYPMQYSPGHSSAEINGMSAGSASPGTPKRPSPGGGGRSLSPAAAYVGSPNVVAFTPGRAIFAQYLAQEGYPQEGSGGHVVLTSASSPGRDGRGKEGVNFKEGSGRAAPPPAAMEAAAAIYSAQGLQGEPPCAVVELGSLLVMFGMPASAAFLPVATTGGASPVKGNAGSSKAASTQNPDGSVRLNARQRRTLRRAQERALAAMDDVRSGVAPSVSSKKGSEFELHRDESFDPHSTNSTPMPMSPGPMYPGPAGTLPIARLSSGEMVAVLPPQVAMQYHHSHGGTMPAMSMQYHHHAMPAMAISPPPHGYQMHSMHAMPVQAVQQYNMQPYMQQQQQQQQYSVGQVVVAGGQSMGMSMGGQQHQQQHQGASKMQDMGLGRRLSRFAPHASVPVR